MMTLKNIKNGVSNQRLNQFIVVLIMSGSAAYFKGVGFRKMNMQHLPAIGSADAKKSSLQNLRNPHECWIFGVITDTQNSRFAFQ